MTAAAFVATKRPERPYPGLRPFDEDEWAIFFGRERMIDEVIGRLADSRLVLIHGVSGSGKSSLVRAGVLPKLALQYSRHAAPWLTCAIQPSGGPLWNLAAEFARLEGHQKDLERISAIAGRFNGRSATLASVAASLEGIDGKSLCVLVDQFEELFRYERETSRDEAELFVNLIERTASEDFADAARDAVDLHVIITMRSEFLGECSRFAGFAETINRTQYLVPRMDNDGLMRAVQRPAQMYGGEFDEELANRLIGSMRGREDELPLLQHGLMLMWEDAKRPAPPGGRATLDGRIVDEAGGLAELLSSHANAVMASAAPDKRSERMVEAVFRALTDVNSEGSAIRRPLPFSELCAVTGTTPEELRPILDAFRASGVSFLTPYSPKPIEDKTPIDISHEALIRCWGMIGDKRNGWLQKEIREGLGWRTLLFQAENFLSDRTNVLSTPAADLGERQLKERNEVWADRYGDGWSKVEELIKASREHWARVHGARRRMTRVDVDRADIQAIARTGFRQLTGASYLLLRVANAPQARRWLGGLEPARLADLSPGGARAAIPEARQVAITAAGLRALGMDEATVQRFSPEFVEGIAGGTSRSQRLGDVGANAPENWRWGVRDREPHILLMLFATPERIAAFLSEARAAAERSGLATIDVLPTSDMGGAEPFGFVDGVSQPSFDWDHVRRPETKPNRTFTNLLSLGELLLGYSNEYGYPAESPTVGAGERNADLLYPAAGAPGERDLGRNGSYLVLRELAQDVLGFWRWTAEESARAGTDPESLAETMVGRRMDGAPLADFETGLALPGVDPADRDVNGFVFDADPDGLSCPVGAHIRRANPRTGDAPAGLEGPVDNLLATLGLTTRRQRKPTSSTLPWENTTVWPYLRHEDDAIASARFHRILRRGREFGKRINPEAALDRSTPDPGAGLQFVCLNANISRQFEFVQGAWLANSKFAGLSGEQDPLVGNRQPFPVPPVIATPQRTDGFTRPGAAPSRRLSSGVPQFVTVRGGAYFFLPGLAALKWIASL